MPKKKKTETAEKPAISKELLDQLLGAVSNEAQSGGLTAILKELTGAVVNRALEAELAAHLDYEDGEPPPEHQSNRRNGHRKKKLRTDHGEVEIRVPRDREGSFEPQLIRPYQRAVPGFEQKVLSMYARGLSDRDICGHFEDLYSVDVSPDLISRVTDAVIGEMKEWRDRPLQARYAIVYLDALVVKVRDSGSVRNKSLYLVIGIDDEGERDVLGMWLQDSEGAKFWLSVLNELKNRGVQDILFLCADGLTGLPEAVEVAFPEAVFQTCVVHLIRSSTRLVNWKDKQAVCKDLKAIYTAPSIDAAEHALDVFEETWGKKYPSVGKAWRTRFAEWSPFLAFSLAIRKAIYTTNTIEATNRQLRKVLKTKGHLPSDTALYKLVYLVLQTTEKSWRRHRPAAGWQTVAAELHLRFKERFPFNEMSPC